MTNSWSLHSDMRRPLLASTRYKRAAKCWLCCVGGDLVLQKDTAQIDAVLCAKLSHISYLYGPSKCMRDLILQYRTSRIPRSALVFEMHGIRFSASIMPSRSTYCTSTHKKLQYIILRVLAATWRLNSVIPKFITAFCRMYVKFKYNLIKWLIPNALLLLVSRRISVLHFYGLSFLLFTISARHIWLSLPTNDSKTRLHTMVTLKACNVHVHVHDLWLQSIFYDLSSRAPSWREYIRPVILSLLCPTTSMLRVSISSS